MLSGTIKPACELPDETIRTREARFARLLGQPVSLACELDRALLGGICVMVGGRRYDGSLRMALDDVAGLFAGRKEAAHGKG